MILVNHIYKKERPEECIKYVVDTRTCHCSFCDHGIHFCDHGRHESYIYIF